MADRTAGLLDRDDELGALAAGAAAAASGDGSLTVVEGVAGSGKTVLLDATRGLETGLRCLRACGSELESDFAFGVVRQLLGGALAGLSSAARAALLAAFPAARIAVGGAESAGRSPPATAPEALHGLHQLLTELAGQQPLQLLVDDAQWADLPSLRWLHYLRLRLGNLPVQVVVAVRTGGGPGLPDDLSFAGARRLSVRPFDRTTVGTLLRDRLVRDVPDAFVDGCLLATGGNPLFVMALIDEIAGQGLDRGLGAVPEIGSAAVSRSVRRRLAALPVEATRYCEALAVLGNRRWPAALQQMAAVDASAARRSWAALVDAGSSPRQPTPASSTPSSGPPSETAWRARGATICTRKPPCTCEREVPPQRKWPHTSFGRRQPAPTSLPKHCAWQPAPPPPKVLPTSRRPTWYARWTSR